jgi:hypothetical protein
VKRPEGFQDAEALADFANLNPKDAASVSYFRNNYPDFTPAEWWDYQTESLELHHVEIKKHIISVWQNTQQQIRRVWRNHFKLKSVFYLTDLLKMVSDAPSGIALNECYVYLPDGTVQELSTSKMYLFHKAILYLHSNPWRAKVCPEKKGGCGKYFVANHPKRDFCEYPDARGETCRHKDDKRRKLEYYYAMGKKKRRAKMRKGSPRLQGSPRKRALR